MELKDLLLTPFYLVLIYALAYRFRKTHTDKVTRRYFIPAFTVKIIGAISLGLIYQFYYTGGDTFNFFHGSSQIWEIYAKDPFAAIQIIFSKAGSFHSNTFQYTQGLYFYNDPASFQVVRLAAFFSLFTFNTYTVNAILFACISFTGVWALYTCLYDMYPGMHRRLAIACFFIPSVFFWGSGLMKDTLCIGAIGWLFYGFYQAFILKRHFRKSICLIGLGAYLLFTIKIYILLAFLPPALFWVFNENSARIKNAGLRLLVKPFFIVIGIIAAYFGGTRLTAGDQVYDINKIGARTKINAEYLYNISKTENGSYYNIGSLDGSIVSMLIVAPQAINVALFRPYLWEVKNPVMLLSAIEASIFLWLTIYLLFKIGLFKSIALISLHPLVSFCFIYGLILAWAVGLNSGNFGTLVRYKIPIMPFYLAGLYVMQEVTRRRKKRIFVPSQLA
jgi:hypothetical protein